MNPNDTAHNDIALVGMAARVPGAHDVRRYWKNLRNGTESIVDLDDDVLRSAGVPTETIENPDYVKRNALLDGVEWFDAGFFDISPGEAALMDPQHRLFLECGWHALEDAGVDPSRFPGSIGVFGGSGHNAYMPLHLLTNPELVTSVGMFLMRHTGNDKDFLTTRLSYCLNLTGPSVNVQTACSTSLVAVHLACQSLLNGECDVALAGGVTIEMPLRHGYLFKPGEILSPDGHCRAFDAKSAGTVFGSGCGVVVLRRLRDAIEAGDNIRAVVKGSAINNDGANKAGYLAPSVDGQATAIAEALEFSAVAPESITYVEAHGTGTALGDPIELAALAQAYGGSSTVSQHCAIGSVKTNIGHLDAAAGVAGLIKVVLALENEELPPSLHYQTPNPEIDFSQSPFYVVDRLTPWPRSTVARRAAVSALGVGGTNAHLVVEEAPRPTPAGGSRSNQLLLLSAKHELSLDAACDNLINFLTEHPLDPLADVAYTLQQGRVFFEKRRAVVCPPDEAPATLLDQRKSPLWVEGEYYGQPRAVAFMFTGQGSQFPGMGAALYASEPVFRKHFDECSQILQPLISLDLRELILDIEDPTKAQNALSQTALAQPALFALEYSLAKLWMYWGVIPDSLIGHSVGEYTAACLADVFNVETALVIIAARGALMQTAPTGSMLAIDATEEEASRYIDHETELAAVNTGSLCVMSGGHLAIDELRVRLDADGVGYKSLRTSHAFHSGSMDGILDDFEHEVSTHKLRAPRIPFVSNLTGEWIRDVEATDPHYWSQHLRRTVRFADGVGELLKSEYRVLLEIGPSKTLASMAAQHPARSSAHACVASLDDPRDDPRGGRDASVGITAAIARLWVAGVPFDWNAYYEGETRNKLSLPGYAFNRQRHWHEPGFVLGSAPQPTDASSRRTVDDWTYTPKWVERPAVSAPTTSDGQAGQSTVLVIAEDGGAVTTICSRLTSLGYTVAHATRGTEFSRTDGDLRFTIRASNAEDYERLAQIVRGDSFDPIKILYLQNLDTPHSRSVEDQLVDAYLDPLALVQGTANVLGPGFTATIGFVTRRGVKLSEDEPLIPVRSALAGVAFVAPLEGPEIDARLIDVGWENEDIDPATIDALVDEWLREDASLQVAIRGGKRWMREFQPERLSAQVASDSGQEPGAVLISGGGSGVGLALARHIAETQDGVSLLLVGRTELPPKSDWSTWLRRQPGSHISRRISALIGLEDAGAAEVHYAAIDVADESGLARFLATSLGTKRLTRVYHAAGEANDGPMLTKSREAVGNVLRSKVFGTIALGNVIRDYHPERYVLFSSVSGLSGVPGQVDYVAANAFLDTFAANYQEHTSIPTTSVNWSPWKETGMSSRIANGVAPVRSDVRHPLIGECLVDEPDLSVHSSRLDPGRHWVLDEHRVVTGECVLPGAAFLELIKVVFDPLVRYKTVELTDVMFLSPFVARDAAPRELRVQIEPWARGKSFTVLSQADPNDSDHWHTHLKGRISATPLAERAVLSVDELQGRLRRLNTPGNEQSAFLRFGRRWDCIESVHMGDEEALLSVALPDEFTDDLDDYVTHPALLDVATAGALSLVEGYDPDRHFYVPIAYNRIRFHGAMGSRCWSHVRYRPADSIPGDIAVFDVTVADHTGTVVAEFDEFMLKQIDNTDTIARATPPLSARTRAYDVAGRRTAMSTGNEVLAERIEASGIDVNSGMALVDTITRSDSTTQVVVSPTPLNELLRELRQSGAAAPARSSRQSGAAAIDVAAVEQRLSTHEAVKESVVVATQDRLGDVRVAAFVELVPLAHTTISELRRYARRELPDEMVPSAILEMDHFPRGPHGKVDRHALPDPFMGEDDYVAPSTPNEHLLTQFWQEILGIQRVSVTDNFFDLGGHSLLAVRVLNAIRKETGVRLEDVAIVTLTLEQTAAELARRAEDVPEPPAQETGLSRIVAAVRRAGRNT